MQAVASISTSTWLLADPTSARYTPSSARYSRRLVTTSDRRLTPRFLPISGRGWERCSSVRIRRPTKAVTISSRDSPATVEGKVSRIVFPPERDSDFEQHHDLETYDVEPSVVTLYNPALQLLKHYIFPRFEHVIITVATRRRTPRGT